MPPKQPVIRKVVRKRKIDEIACHLDDILYDSDKENRGGGTPVRKKRERREKALTELFGDEDSDFSDVDSCDDDFNSDNEDSSLHTESVSVQVDFSESDDEDGSSSGEHENSEILEAPAILDSAATIISVPEPVDQSQNVHHFETDFHAADNNEWLQEFHHPTGLLFDHEGMNEFDIFYRLLGGDRAIDLMVSGTNRYAQQYITKIGFDNLKPHSNAKKWAAVTHGDIKAFLSIILYMGHCKLPCYEDYWTTDGLFQIGGFRDIMPRDRFFSIMQFFHLSDNDIAIPRGQPGHDRLAKIRPFTEILIPAWQDAYYPGQNLSVDESIVAFKGRCGFVVYKPNKPHKWGLNAWVCANSTNGYVYNWELYCGKSEEPTGRHGLTHNVVTHLLLPIYNQGHIVYMDNYFPSPALFDELAENQTGACGTLRVNRCGVPELIKRTKTEKCGDLVSAQDGKKLFLSWHDKRQVNLISTVHSATTFVKEVRCKDPDNGNIRRIVKPMAVELCTQHMGGVDRLDRQVWCHLEQHRTMKWWKKLFVYLLEVTVCQAKVVWEEAHGKDARRLATNLRKNIIHGLIDGYTRSSSRRAGRPSALVEKPFRLTERHFPSYNPKKNANGKKHSIGLCCV